MRRNKLKQSMIVLVDKHYEDKILLNGCKNVINFEVNKLLGKIAKIVQAYYN